MPASPGYFFADAAPELDRRLRLLLDKRIVLLAGLPGSGKSLFAHQLAHFAHDEGRDVSLLQWDVARTPFEASAAGQRYPIVDGVTHVLIRRAVGLWARERVLRWHRENPGTASMLIGEAPLIGNRLIELVTPAADEAEALLAAPDCVFILPVPSNDLRRHIESERERRFRTPVHQRELEDAPPNVMQTSWLELLASARQAGIASPANGDSYDAGIYHDYYASLLGSRRSEIIAVDCVLPTTDMSVYDYAFECASLTPSPEEAERWIRVAEAQI